MVSSFLSSSSVLLLAGLLATHYNCCTTAAVATATTTTTTTAEQQIDDKFDLEARILQIYNGNNNNNNKKEQGRRSLEEADECSIGVEIVECLAFLGNGASTTCDMVDSTTCNVGIQYKLALTNNADPFSSRFFLLDSRNNNFYGKGSKKKKPDEDDGTVTITNLAEVFKSSSATDGKTVCPTQDELIDGAIVLSPGESMTLTSGIFTVNVCDCPDLTFGVAATATSEASSSGKKKKNGEMILPSFFDFEAQCSAAADVVKTVFAIEAPSLSPSASLMPSSAPSVCTPTFSASGVTFPKRGDSTDWWFGDRSNSCTTVCADSSVPSGTCAATQETSMTAVDDATKFDYVLDLFDVGKLCTDEIKKVSSTRSPGYAGKFGFGFYSTDTKSTCGDSNGSDYRFCCCGTDCPTSTTVRRRHRGRHRGRR